MLSVINKSNSKAFDELVQDYEEEFSSITGKKRDLNGKYSIDVDWQAPNIGYYWQKGSNIAGFCIVDFVDGYSDIAEFYVAPSYRKNKIGQTMAFAVFNQHPGPWQVRQLLGAELAKKFWRRVIN